MTPDASQHNAVIATANIGPFPQGLSDLRMPAVTVTYDDDTTEELFTFYPDELHFTADEFVGLTREQALALRSERDRAYLRNSTLS